MKNVITILLLFVGTAYSWAQPYGNEWIDYSRQHYVFKIVNDGVYRISHSTMQNAGMPVESINPTQFKLYGKDKEQPIRVVDGGDNSFDPGDYIEFYAERNDGWLDSLLYSSPNDIANPAYSLYNDTLCYFLTWGSGSSKRYIEETDVNFNNYTPSNYVLNKSIIDFNGFFHGGFNSMNVYSSSYVEGEGWGDQSRNGVAGNYEPRQVNVPTPSPYTGGDAPSVKFHGKSSGNSNATGYTGEGNHHFRWQVGASNQVIHDDIFIGFKQKTVNETFNPSLLGNSTTSITFNIVNDQGATTDFQAVHYLYLEYARQPNLNNQSRAKLSVLNSTTQAKVRLDFTNANLTTPTCFVTGGSVPRALPMVNNGGVWQVLIPNGTGTNKQQLVISSQNQIQTVSKLSPVNGNGMFTNFNDMNFESAFIMIYHKSLETAANNYATYRASAEGGSHNTLLLDVHELYYQFGGGVEKHILGLKRMANMAYNLPIEKPVGLFLMGKGVKEANEPRATTAELTAGTRKSISSFERNLIPSYGFPSSDIYISNIFNEGSIAPAIPTGRISAKTNQELENYLNKMKAYESNQNQSDVYNKPNKEWQKQVLHFGGGSESKEQKRFRNYLNSYKNKIEGADFGGNVTSFFKTDSNPFNPTLASDVNKLLEKGASLMTFFGHGSPEGFDQNIDNPENWNNTGKYPMVIGNSCFTGDIFQSTSISASEVFVLEQDLGAIGFMSSTKLGVDQALNTYTSEVYNQISPKSYGLPFSQQVINAIKNIESSNTSLTIEATMTQMALHSDPAMRLNWHGLPEFDLTAQDIYFEPTTFDLSTDSVKMHIVVTNLGKSALDTFGLDVRRNFPSTNIDSLYHFAIKGLNYRDTIVLTLPVQQEIGIGLNRFNVQVDIPSFVEELYDEYGNNEVSIDLFVDIDGITPVLPYNYAVVPDDSVVLKASTINPIASYNSYIFEIDTTDLFNSPFKKYARVSGLGGVKEVFPNEWTNVNSNANSPLVLEDSMAYFWRVAVDTSAPIWTEHSFQYIKDKEGWGQDHFFQFKNGGFTGVGYNRDDRNRTFEPVERLVECEVYDNANSNFTFRNTLWKLNGQVVESNMCGTNPSLHVAVIDPQNMEPWGTYHDGQNEDKQFGNINPCRDRVEQYFSFRQNSTEQLQAFENMVMNEVPDGHFLLIYTARYALYDQWQNLHPGLFNSMQSLGGSMQPNFNNRAFIFFVKKGDPDSAEEVFAQSAGQFITLQKEIVSAESAGVETSTIIGPAAKWNTLFWKQNTLDDPNFDKTALRIRALDSRRNVMFEIDTNFTHNDSITNLNSIIPADDYPYLQLRALYKDTANQTPAQIDRWHVLYDPLPEAAIDGTVQYTFRPISADSLKEGQDITFAVDVKNISHLPMDSLLIDYWVIDKNQNVHPIPYKRQDSLRPGEVLRDTISFETRGLAGSNILWMEVNPFGVNNKKDQPELAHFNNILQLPFHIEADDINPILDVTFDGMHILNGDIVNPNAEIVITLKDNNPFLVMNEDADTSLFGIYITPPGGVQKRVPFIDGNGQQIMQWIPAGDDLKFKIIYPARFKEEGEYELFIQGTDKSGNVSGDLEYRIKFDVVLGSSITQMMNYPNPFSTKTRFVFTLTGSEIPDEVMIQIMTVTGRLVRTITQDELGPIRIGRNVTQYAWNGRDEFGDQLANGVYLYKMTARINGESIDHRDSGADQHFKKNWGKMYLMR